MAKKGIIESGTILIRKGSNKLYKILDVRTIDKIGKMTKKRISVV